MNSGAGTYTIGSSFAPSRPLAVVSGVSFLVLGGLSLVLWQVGGWSLALAVGVGAIVFGVAFGVSMWSLTSRASQAPPLAADADALRLAMPAAMPLALPWESLREVRVERAPLGHRVTAVPIDIDEALARLPERVPRVTRQRWQRSGRISVGVGQRSTDIAAIVAALAELAAGRCDVVRG